MWVVTTLLCAMRDDSVGGKPLRPFGPPPLQGGGVFPCTKSFRARNNRFQGLEHPVPKPGTPRFRCLKLSCLDIRNCFEFLQKVFSSLDVLVFVCALGDFPAIFVSVLRQIARYLPHHRNKTASKTHPKSSHDKFKTVSYILFRGREPPLLIHPRKALDDFDFPLPRIIPTEFLLRLLYPSKERNPIL